MPVGCCGFYDELTLFMYLAMISDLLMFVPWPYIFECAFGLELCVTELCILRPDYCVVLSPDLSLSARSYKLWRG